MFEPNLELNKYYLMTGKTSHVEGRVYRILPLSKLKGGYRCSWVLLSNAEGLTEKLEDTNVITREGFSLYDIELDHEFNDRIEIASDVKKAIQGVDYE